MPIITEDGLRELDKYKYHSGGYSILDNKLNPFWEWVETLFPRTMAPNTITLIGFGFMAASYLAMLYYDSSFSKSLPGWTYIFAAVCQFIYQTLDAVDGKHARVTKASSPLGQLFDHGCDSFSCTFVILTVCQTLKLGPSGELLFFCCLLQLAFFVANWSEYHSGVLTTSVQYFGVTEGQLIICATLLIAGVFGPEVGDWSVVSLLNLVNVKLDVSGFDSNVRWFFVTGLKLVALRGMYVLVGSIIVYFVITTLKIAKNKIRAIAQFFPVLSLLGTLYFWSHLDIFKKYSAEILLSSALTFSLITSKLIIGSLTRMTLRTIQREVLIFLLLGLVLKYVAPQVPVKGFDIVVLYSLPIFIISSVIIWANAVIFEISSHLGIYCFSLEKRDKKKN